jgi:hypothetical protein
MHVSPRPGWPSSVQGSPQLWQCRVIYDLQLMIYDWLVADNAVQIINRKS